MVRTSGFHPGNRGSIPLGATKFGLIKPNFIFPHLILTVKEI